ncbi:GNAT family N-acetyltransferase [Aidingimonas lacisalsi]|uniref:GNAT family N-acetyltransferase n=1 Tax=Aidingimonas lacisalsi TaxID=2604086 RepID=UPI0011D1C0AB|nr:GNAT family N-acetyltransferase [Aidingimonas lacisalsi]
MTELSVRKIVPDDAESIAALWLGCTAEVAETESIYVPAVTAEELTDELAREFEARRRFGWVAHTESQLAGYVTCAFQSESTLFVPREYLYVHDLDVAPAFRQHGVSRLLMEYVEGYARAQGVRRVELGVVWNDPRSRAVWEKHGFEPHFVCMHKDL